MLNSRTRQMQGGGMRRGQRGLSLVELMVGITIGLIVTAGASMVAVNQINEHRRLMQETQMQQDLRITADLVQQDMRRAGFRGIASLGIWTPASGVGTGQEVAPMVAVANPYDDITVTAGEQKFSIQYSYAHNKDDDGAYIVQATPQANEYFGVKMEQGTIYLQIGKVNGQPNWQPVTDPEAVSITDFAVDVASQKVPLNDFCDTATAADAGPKLEIREIKYQVRAQAKHDAAVRRTLAGNERIHADKISGACPP